jgi:integrase
VKTNQTGQTADNAETKSDWVKTQYANIIRYEPSRILFARVRVRGKLFRQSLKTNKISIAKLRLGEFMKDKQEEMGDDSAARSGKMTVGHAVSILRKRLDGQQDIKEGAKVYRRKCIEALLKSWPELEAKPVGKVGKDDCLNWAEKYAKQYSPSVYNNSVGTLRMIFDIVVEQGARGQNPARFITKKRIVQRELDLPSPEQFEGFVSAIAEAGAWCSRECADLVQFLAYGGFRKTEAANITFADCDFGNGQVRVRITKNGKPRSVPMIPNMKALLERIKAERPAAQPGDMVMQVRECQKAMDNAAKKVGMPRITHHDLRHLFATRCIESGVDIPTVSRWLGHQDGGALAMKVYGHLRDHHSVAMASKVTFGKPTAENIVQLPQEQAG